MGIWKPEVRVESNRVLELNRDNPVAWTYTLSGGRTFPPGTTATLTLRNTYGQTVDEWIGIVTGGTISFIEPVEKANAVPRGTSWILIAILAAVTPRMLAQGTVTRIEAPFPDAPPKSSEFDGVAYSYAFATTGFVVDPAWRIMNGHPRVYAPGSGKPNCVAAGSLLGGDLTIFDDVAMLWFAPLRTDAVRLTYNTVPQWDGEAWAVICSNYDMTSFVAIHHVQRTGASDYVAIATGTSPVTLQDRVTVNHDTLLENWTAEYNPASNTYAVYLGTSAAPLLEWEDNTNVKVHGEGERYVGFGFKSALLSPGAGVCDWFIADTP